MDFDSIKEGAKKIAIETGRKIIGQGPEVAFSSEVDEYEKNNGVSAAEAKKVIFFERIADLGIGLKDFESDDYRNFYAGVSEIFDEAELEQFKIDAGLPTFTTPSRTVSSKEFNNIKKQFEGKYDGRVPCTTINRVTAENYKEIEELLARFSGHSAHGGTADLNAMISSFPELGADIGKILMLKEEIERSKDQFGREVTFDDSLENLKDRTGSALAGSFFDEVKMFSKSMIKGTNDVSKGKFGQAITHTTAAVARATAKGTLGATKIGFSAVKAAGSYINKSIKR